MGVKGFTVMAIIRGQIDYKVHHGMQSNFIKLKMMTDDTKETVATIQIMTVRAVVGEANALEVPFTWNMIQC